MYPFPYDGIDMWKSTAAFCLLLAATVYIFRAAKTRRYLFVGWLWYLGMLVPVIGIIRVGEQALADRFTYLPMIGIFIMIGWAGVELLAKAKVPYKKACVSIAAIVLAIVLTGLTRNQVKYWENSITLFGHAVKVTRNNYVMHYNYGSVLGIAGRLDESVEQYNKALKMFPGCFISNSKLGMIYQFQGKSEKAIKHLRKALEIKPDDVKTLNRLAVALQSRDASWESIIFLEKSINLNPEQPEILDRLADAYGATGMFDKAVETSQKAFELANSVNNKGLAESIKKRQELYKQAKVYIEPTKP